MPDWKENTYEEFGTYSRNVFLDGEVADATMGTAARKARIRQIMDLDAEGLPLIPDEPAGDDREKLDDLKALLREFLNMHFSEHISFVATAVSDDRTEAATGSTKARAPWTHITQNPFLYFDQEMTPERMGLRDPSHMTDGPLRSLLAYWRERQLSNGGVSPFRFKAYMLKHDDDGNAIMAPAVYDQAVVERPKKQTRKNKKSKPMGSKKARGKRPARRVQDEDQSDEFDMDVGAESDHSSDDEEDASLIRIKPASWAKNSRTRRHNFLVSIGAAQAYFEAVELLDELMVSSPRR